jgi:hypothetical protein
MTTHSRNEIPVEKIRARAFERFAARGFQHGHDVDDWLAAERSLRIELATAQARPDETPVDRPLPHREERAHHHRSHETTAAKQSTRRK